MHDVRADRQPRIKQTLLLGCLLQALGAQASAEFNVAFLQGDMGAEALRAVQQGDAILPGVYPFSVFVNGQQVERTNVRFVRNAQGNVGPCLSAPRLREYGILIDTGQAGSENEALCFELAQAVPESRVDFEAGAQRVDLQVPQISMQQVPRGSVPQRLWDQGINAAMLGYNFLANRSSGNGNSSNYYYLGLQGGVNVGAWRLRHNASVTRSPWEGVRYTAISTRLERDLIAWRSRIEIGDAYTSNEVFNSMSFRGVQLSSDDAQLPYSLQGFAPVIRGVAQTNARVEVRQGGYVLYAANVAPGAFELRDIVPTAASGDLEIRIIEADGSVRTFLQPFSAVPNMLREGLWRYQITGGQSRQGGGDNDRYAPYFMQVTLARGFDRAVTPYGGLLVAENYAAANIGLGKGMGTWGAASVDLTLARTNLASGARKSGGSVRFLYSKTLNAMGTDFRLIGHRYSSEGYYDFADAVSERAQWRGGLYEYQYAVNDGAAGGVPDWVQRQNSLLTSRYYNKRSQVQIAMNQPLGRYGQVYTNFTSQNYWAGGRKQLSWQVGYARQLGSVMASIYFQASRDRFLAPERNVGVMFSIPLGDRVGVSGLRSVSQITNSSVRGTSVQTGLSGSLLEDRNLMVSAQAGRSYGGDIATSANAAYQGAKGVLDVGYSSSGSNQQFRLGASGALLLHAGGLTLGQRQQETMVLVEAENAGGVALGNQSGARIDARGYALAFGSSPYQRTTISLRSEEAGGGIEFLNTSVDVVPTRGAVVKAKFDTLSGQSLLIEGTLADGKPLLAGSTVYGGSGRSQGVVGPGGVAYVSGVNPYDELMVRWAEGAGGQCRMQVGDLPPAQPQQAYTEARLVCQPVREGVPNE